MNVLFCTKQRKQLWEQRPGNYGKSSGKAPPNGGTVGGAWEPGLQLPQRERPAAGQLLYACARYSDRGI